jgi:MFS transporter, DHA1 family, multidrug resistance protein
MNLKNRSIAILFAALFVVMLGFGIIIPVLPLYARSMGATSVHLGLLMATFSIFQFIFAPIWGSLSDRIGRKPVMLIGLIGYALSHVINGLAGNLYILFLSRIMGGVLSSATLPTSLAMVSDVTGDDQRGSGMGILGAAMGLGVIFGPSLGGLVSHGFASYRMPFFLAAGLVVILIPLAWIFIDETLPAAEREKHRLAHQEDGRPGRWAELVTAMKGNLAFYFVLAFLTSFAQANLEGIFSFFAMDKFNYGTREIGIIFTAIGIVSVILQGLLVGKAIKWFGESKLIVFGLLITAVGFYLTTRATGLVPLTAFLALNMAGGSFVRPSLNSAISKKTLVGQGATMGLMGSFDSLGRIAGPVWAGLVYRWGVNLPFHTGAAITAIGLVLAVIVFSTGSHIRNPALTPNPAEVEIIEPGPPEA